jgi:hypothetical protein
MIDKWAFKMVSGILSYTYTGYYIHKRNRQFELVAVNKLTCFYISPSISENRITNSGMYHLDNILSYDALITRARRAKTYSVERVLYEDVKDIIEEIRQNAFIENL